MLSSRIPYPLTAGFRIRIYNEAKYFKLHGHSVDLLYIGSQEDYERNKKYLEEVFDAVYHIPMKKIEIAKNLIMASFQSVPFQVALYRNKEFQHKLLQINNQYDLFIANHIRTAEYLACVDSNKVIIDLHDAISYNYSQLIDIGKGIKQLIYRIEYKRVLDYEKQVVETFQKVVIVSEEDKEWLRRNGAKVTNINVIPVAVRDDIESAKTSYSDDENSICFLGKMSYQPNEDAVLWFTQNVMPELVMKYPNIRFYIMGIEPSESIRALGRKNNNVIVTGYVENPYSIIAKAKASVVPIRNGAGVQNKVLESMFVGTPVVASDIAANGIGAVNNKQLLIARDKEEYIEHLSTLIESEKERERLGQEGKKYIEENFTWKALWKKWEKLIAKEGS